MANGIIDIDVDNIKLCGNLIFDFKALQRKITPLILLTKREPETELEKFVVETQAETEDGITQETIEKLKLLHSELQSKIAVQTSQFGDTMDEIRVELDALRQNENLELGYSVAGWKLLQKAKEILTASREIKIQKSATIFKAVMEIRSELRLLWRESMVLDEEGDFPEFHTMEITEEVLEIHKDKLSKWKAYYKKNQELFRQVQNRATLWQRLRELLMKEQDPLKFVNRGAMLLKNQTEMHHVLAGLGKCEEALKSLVKTYEEENGKKVLIQGKELSERLASDWNEYKSMRDAGTKGLRAQVTTSAQTRSLEPMLLHSLSQCRNKREQLIYNSNPNISGISTRSRAGK